MAGVDAGDTGAGPVSISSSQLMADGVAAAGVLELLLGVVQLEAGVLLLVRVLVLGVLEVRGGRGGRGG